MNQRGFCNKTIVLARYSDLLNASVLTVTSQAIPLHPLKCET